jgi:uncharacterized protein with HEPN domain
MNQSKIYNLIEGIVKDNPELLNEASYRQFKTDNERRTSKQVVGEAVRKIRRSMNEIEKIIEFTHKMKNEMKDEDKTYWSSTKNHLSDISERMNHISAKIRELSN